MENLKIDYESTFIQGQYGTYGALGDLTEDRIDSIHLVIENLEDGTHFTTYLDDDFNVFGLEETPEGVSYQEVVDFVNSQGGILYPYLEDKISELEIQEHD